MTLIKELSGSILDLGGGGEGVIGRVYGADVTAIDVRQEELDEAPDGPRKLCMDACALAFPNESFAHVTAFYFFMYLEKAQFGAALSEAFRVLTPGGGLHIWDAAIERAAPFLVSLAIDAAGTPVHTTYGVQKPDAAQDADGLCTLACAAGFVLEHRAELDGQLELHFVKPAAR